MSQPSRTMPSQAHNPVFVQRSRGSDPCSQYPCIGFRTDGFSVRARELFHTPPITMKKWVRRSAGRRPAFWTSWRRSLCRISSFAPMKLRPASYVMANGRLISIRDFSAQSVSSWLPGKILPTGFIFGTGYYADLTLIYQKGALPALPWTYPDYLEPELLHYLGVLRKETEISVGRDFASVKASISGTR